MELQKSSQSTVSMINVFMYQTSYRYFPISDLSKIEKKNSVNSYWMWNVYMDLDWMSPSMLKEQNMISSDVFVWTKEYMLFNLCRQQECC